MTEQLNLTDVMTEVQNFITSDGQIIPCLLYTSDAADE